MNKTLAGMVRLLDEGDGALKCSVVQVLGALSPSEPALVTALLKHYREADQYLSHFILDALGAIGSETALDALVGFLESEEGEQDRIILALARAGERGEAAVVRRWDECDRETYPLLLEVLVRTQGPLAVDKLCETLRRPTWNLGPKMVEHLKERVSSFPDEQLKKFRAKLGGFIRSRLKNVEPEVIANHLEILSRIPSPSLGKTLVRFAGPQWPGMVRRAAIQNFSRVEIPPAKVLDFFAYLYEKDYTNVVGPMLRYLKGMEFGEEAQDELLSLLDPKEHLHPQIRSFAMEALARFKDQRTARALVPFLEDEEEWARMRAAVALEGNIGARTMLQNRLLKATGEKEMKLLLRPLQSIAERLTPNFLRKAFNYMEELREQGFPAWTLLREFLWEADGDFVVKEGLARARRLRKESSFARTEELLLTIAMGREPDPEMRYEIAMAQILKNHRDVNNPPQADPAMGHLQKLVEEGEGDLVSVLAKEKQLKPEDLLYIGLHFLGRSPRLAEFGGQVLGQLLKRWPHSKSAKVANQKIKTSGIEHRA